MSDDIFDRMFADDPTLPADLADELEMHLSPARRDELIAAAEHVQFTGDLRQRVVASLLYHARWLRDHRDGRPEILWSAMRRYASMVPAEESDALLEFMRDSDEVKTIQCAMQCVENIYRVERPAGAARERLLARVHHLSLEWSDPDRVKTSADAVMAFCCFRAAVALRDPDVGEHFERLERLSHKRLAERAKALMDDVK